MTLYLKKIEKFYNVSINIYTFNNVNESIQDIYPLYLTKKKQEEHHNLLFYSSKDETV